MTSATERIRAMLDERRVEWTANDSNYVKETCWPYMGELTAAFAEYNNGMTRFVCDTWCFTPEQAIAATLGTGTCHITDNGPWGYPYVCSACGASFDPDVNNGEVNYCPNCGRKVVDA